MKTRLFLLLTHNKCANLQSASFLLQQEVSLVSTGLQMLLIFELTGHFRLLPHSQLQLQQEKED